MDALAILKALRCDGRVSVLQLGMRGITLARILKAWPILERSDMSVLRNGSHLWVQKRQKAYQGQDLTVKAARP